MFSGCTFPASFTTIPSEKKKNIVATVEKKAQLHKANGM